jgi:hypothetical protein
MRTSFCCILRGQWALAAIALLPLVATVRAAEPTVVAAGGLDVLGDLLLGIPATVDDVIFTGSHWHVYLDFGETRFVADLPMQWPPPPAGARIRVRPSPGPTVGFCGDRRLLLRWAAFTD